MSKHEDAQAAIDWLEAISGRSVVLRTQEAIKQQEQHIEDNGFVEFMNTLIYTNIAIKAIQEQQLRQRVTDACTSMHHSMTELFKPRFCPNCGKQLKEIEPWQRQKSSRSWP